MEEKIWSYNESGNKEKLPYIHQFQKLKQDVENTTSFRSSLCSILDISQNRVRNSAVQNFSLGIIDWLMEFPIIIELYINNISFRDLLWKEIQKITFSDFMDSFSEIGQNVVSWSSYEKWKAGVRVLLLLSGIGWLLKQFGYSVVKNAGNISVRTISVATGITWIHGVWYATENRWKKTIRNSNPDEVLKNLLF